MKTKLIFIRNWTVVSRSKNVCCKSRKMAESGFVRGIMQTSYVKKSISWTLL